METDREDVAFDDLRQRAEASTPAFITVPQAAKSLPSGRNGRPTHAATIIRWITSGSKGPNGEIVRLRAVRLGGRWLTSRAWLADYAARMTPDFEAHSSTPPRSTAVRSRQSAAASATLDEIGI